MSDILDTYYVWLKIDVAMNLDLKTVICEIEGFFSC